MIIAGIISKLNLQENKLVQRIKDVFQRNDIINCRSYLNDRITLYTGKLTNNDQNDLIINDNQIVVGRAF